MMWPAVDSALSAPRDPKQNVSIACLMTLAYISKNPTAIAICEYGPFHSLLDVNALVCALCNVLCISKNRIVRKRFVHHGKVK